MTGRTVKKKPADKAAKPAVQSLRESQPAGSQEELEAAFNSITELVMLLDSDYKIKWANKATSDFLKLPLTEITGKYCYTLMHGTDKPVENCPLAEMIKSQSHEEAELYLEQRKVWARVTVDPQYDIKGNLVSVVHTVNDVTEHKQADSIIQESEVLYRTLIETSPDAIGLMDMSGTILMVNKRALEVFGFDSTEELRGTNIMDLVAPENYNKVLENMETLQKAEVLRNLELSTNKKDGRPFYVEISSSMLLDEEGNPKSIMTVFKDVTGRKRAEEALRESEEKYRTLIEKANEAIIIVQDGNFVFVNRRMCELLGVPEGYLEGKPFVDYVWPEDRELVTTNYMKRIAGETTIDAYDFRIIGPAGRLTWVYISGAKIQWEGRPASISLITDITERKLAEEALKESEERFRNMANLLPQVVFETDGLGNFTFVNRQGFETFGYNEIDITRGMNVLDTIALEDRQRAMENIGNRIKGIKFPSQEYTAVRKDGSKFRAAIFAAPIVLNNAYAGMRGTLVDMTEHNRIEAALLESEEKYRLLVEKAQEAIIIAVGNTVKFANRSAMEMSGYSQDELASRPFIEFVHPEDRQMVAERYLQRIEGIEVPNIYAFRIVNKSGGIRWAEVSVALVTWEGTPATLNFLTDVTDHKRLEEEQQRVEKLESIGLLAGGIAHDFNNILTAILGNISLARMEATPGSDVLESLEQAEKASLRAKDLTRQLLTFSKGGAPLTKLASLTELLKDTARFALRGSNVKCHFSIPDDLWHAEIDAGQVSQVIHNLVINAQQAMPAGGTIDFAAENIILSETQSLGRGLPLKQGNYVRIAVTDRGSGIPAEHLAKIFDPFFTTKQGGSGLGLATSFSIARHHGGHLSVESEPGTGSSFYLYLPASMETSVPSQHIKERIRPAGKARILVMDDEKGVREVAGRMLKHIGYEDVEFATDGAEAVRRYKEAMESGQPFNAVILDLTVAGGMGGRETIKQLLEVDPEVRAIVSSGYAEESVMAEYREYGFCGMVAKPYSIEQLGKTVRDLIG